MEKTISEIRAFKVEAEEKLTDFIHATVEQFQADTGLKVKGVIMVGGARGAVAEMQIDFHL